MLRYYPKDSSPPDNQLITLTIITFRKCFDFENCILSKNKKKDATIQILFYATQLISIMTKQTYFNMFHSPLLLDQLRNICLSWRIYCTIIGCIERPIVPLAARTFWAFIYGTWIGLSHLGASVYYQCASVWQLVIQVYSI